MKRHCFTSYPLFALIGLILSPLAAVHASPSPADSVHFYNECGAVCGGVGCNRR